MDKCLQFQRYVAQTASIGVVKESIHFSRKNIKIIIASILQSRISLLLSPRFHAATEDVIQELRLNQYQSWMDRIDP